ncbi:MAG: hypothetical protein LQ347_001336 [Umbilicaria vellea]|nr:MAG: hypothetical protein LQ347_001336 [Umbilicaria vellea]
MDNVFIGALVKAASCRQHASSRTSSTTSPFKFHRPRRRQTLATSKRDRALHAPPSDSGQSEAASAETTREEYENLIDYYHETHDEQRVSFEDSTTCGLPHLEGEDTQSEVKALASGEVEGYAKDEIPIFEKLVHALNDESVAAENIYELYQDLPLPRVTYLSEDLRHSLLRRLSIVKRKNQETMLRYLSVMDDMKAAGHKLTSGEWSSAIAFAGRCITRVTAAQVESALLIWKKMELVANFKGTNVTFNILFDIATKAGKFVLAEMILKEMKARGLALNRFARVGLIYYHGLKGDGDGVRKAYRDFVQAGEIVDTVALNCVVASLIRAGELPAADHVYERMKRMHARRTGTRLPPRNWKRSRELGRMLNRAAKNYRRDPEKRQRLQDEQSLAPNLHTFSIFVDHHVTRTGELQRVATLLHEMQFFDVALDGSMFLKLFKGFATHGGIRYSSWTTARLESVWVSFQNVLEEEIEDIRVGKWISIWALRAFTKCCGKERTLQIWEELKSRWKPDASESGIINGILHKLLKIRDFD